MALSGCGGIDGIKELFDDITGNGGDNNGNKTSSYSITVLPSGNGSVSAPSQAKAEAMVTLTVSPEWDYSLTALTVTKAGGGTVNVSGSGPYTFNMPADNVTVSAVFGAAPANLYTVAPYNDDYGSVTANSERAAEGATVTLSVSAADGYGLVSDSLKVDNGAVTLNKTGGTTYTFEMPARDVVVTAEFKEHENPSVILAEGISGGTVDRDPENAAAGAEIKLTVVPYEGYQYTADSLTVTKAEGGAVNVSGSGPYTFNMPAENVTVTASFTPITYTVVYNGNAAGVSGSTTQSSHTYGVEQALTANGFSRTGYNFAGWTTGSDGGGTSYADGASVTNLSSTNGAMVNLYAKWTAVPVPNTISIGSPSTNGSGWSFSNNTVTISESGNYIITGSTNANRVVVAANVEANITLNGVSIDVSGVSNACAFYITPGATANITLAENTTNTLKSNGTAAGLQVPKINNVNATLVIASAEGAGSTSGTLNAYGGLGSGAHSGAGIGGGQAQDGGAITITGGTVNAYGYYLSSETTLKNAGAGIGGGGNGGSSAKAGDGGTIRITGGNVTATGGSSALKSNGNVESDSSGGAAGIGGGSGEIGVVDGGSGGTIEISGGTVTASSIIRGAGIGGGNRKGAGGTIIITGGTVTATGGKFAAGIGGGGINNNEGYQSYTYGAAGGTITISGGMVTATGGDRCPGIGGGFCGAGGTITINGVSVTNEQGTSSGSAGAKTISLGTFNSTGTATGTATSGPNTGRAIGAGDGY